MSEKGGKWKLVVIFLIFIGIISWGINYYKINVLPQKVYEELSN